MDRDEYFTLLNLGNPVRERLAHVIGFYEGLLPEPIQRIFVSETVDQEGARLVESLWLITENLICEAHTVLTSDTFDMAANIDYRHFILESQDYAVGAATPKSRMRVKYSFAFSMWGELKASGANCDVLFDLVREVFVPRTARIRG